MCKVSKTIYDTKQTLRGAQTERWTEPADRHNTSGQFDPEIHNTEGLTWVSVTGAPQSIDSKIIEASRQLGGEFAYNRDMNDGNLLGLGRYHSLVRLLGDRKVHFSTTHI